MATVFDYADVVASQSARFRHAARVSNQANTVNQLSRILRDAFGLSAGTNPFCRSALCIVMPVEQVFLLHCSA